MSGKLRGLKSSLKALDGRLRVLITPTEEVSVEKLRSMQAAGIDFLAVDTEMIFDARKAIQPLLAQSAKPSEVLQAVGDAVLKRILRRWEVTEGQPPEVRPGYQTGALYESMKNATVKVKRDDRINRRITR